MATCGAAVASCLVLLSCGVEPVSISRLTQDDMPRDLTLPHLQGNANQVVDELCRWVSRNNIPYSDAIVERVYFPSRFHPEPFSPARALLDVYLQRDFPRQLALQIGPDDIMAETRHNVVEQLVNARGLWLFEKRPTPECVGHTLPNTVHYTENNWDYCVRGTLTASPPTDFTLGDFRQWIFTAEIGGFVPIHQQVTMNILTYERGDAVVGRSIFVWAFAGPMDWDTPTEVAAEDQSPSRVRPSFAMSAPKHAPAFVPAE